MDCSSTNSIEIQPNLHFWHLCIHCSSHFSKTEQLAFCLNPLPVQYFSLKSKPPYNNCLPAVVTSFCVRVAILETFSYGGHSDQHLSNFCKLHCKEISACTVLVFNQPF